MSLSTFAFSSSRAIADAGHSFTHVSHPVHFSLSTTATNSFTPSYMFSGKTKKGFLFDEPHQRRVRRRCEASSTCAHCRRFPAEIFFSSTFPEGLGFIRGESGEDAKHLRLAPRRTCAQTR